MSDWRRLLTAACLICLPGVGRADPARVRCVCPAPASPCYCYRYSSCPTPPAAKRACVRPYYPTAGYSAIPPERIYAPSVHEHDYLHYN